VALPKWWLYQNDGFVKMMDLPKWWICHNGGFATMVALPQCFIKNLFFIIN
jgi:hypothetical protein